MTPGADVLTILNLVLTVALAIGGFIALKSGYSRQASEAQRNAIDAMEKEINTLKGQVSELRSDNRHYQLILDIIIESLKKRGLILTIEKTSITIEDQSAHTTHITRIEEESK